MTTASDILSKMMYPMRKPVTVDEGALRVRIARGQSAADLKDNENFTSLITEVEDFYLLAWRQSKADDLDVREKCHVAIKIVDDMRNLLLTRVRDGELARESLQKAMKASSPTK